MILDDGASPGRSDCSTSFRLARCAEAPLRQWRDAMPRHWLFIQALILIFVAAGMVIAITKLA